MAELKPLIATDQLKTSLLAGLAKKKPQQCFVNYDDDFDALMILVVSPDTETVVHYLDEHIALLYQPETLEIVGLQVEAFESNFVPSHSSVQRVWRLSDAVGSKLESVGDMLLVVEKIKPEVAREVVNASHDLPEELTALFAA
jgi:hypothetical protein